MAENDANADGGDEIQVGKRSKLPMILVVLGFLIIGVGLGYAASVVMAPADPAAAWGEPRRRPARAKITMQKKDSVGEKRKTNEYLFFLILSWVL